MQLRIAIISDIHSHHKPDKEPQRSYILTNVNSTTFQDPYKSFVHLIKTHPEIKADILLMPGDFGDQSDEEGIAKGWEVTKSVAKLLDTDVIIPNIGNHDVDSRKKYNADPFYYIKSFASDFPFNTPEQNDFFWDKGYLIIEEAHYRILVVNSVHNHINETEADHGLISEDTLNELEEIFQGFHDQKLNIAMCHHNPILHSRFGSKNKDLMYNGDQLLNILDNFNFDMVIHGHKHDPRILYSQGGANSPVIFSAGSFAAYSSQLLQGAYNTFHIITLEVTAHQIGKGTVETWFFVPTKGWKQEIRCEHIEPKIGFGEVVDLKRLANEILAWFRNNGIKFIEWDEFLKHFPVLVYIIPSDLMKLKKDLKTKHILVSPKLPNEPVFVQYKPVKLKS